MPRLVIQQVEVAPSPGGEVPLSFIWRKKQYSVDTILERWRESGRWWEGEAVREIYRVADVSGRVFELHRLGKPLLTVGADGDTKQWVLYRVED